VEIAVPTISAGEALVRVEACGICGSDLGIVAGVHPRARVPLTLGHEFCGTIVEQAGSGSSLQVGDRVTAWPLVSCGVCWVCRHGAPHVCRSLRLYGIDFDGGMAQYVRLPVASILSLPPDTSPLTGAVVEPLAVAVHGVGLAPRTPSDAVVVMGAGPIGLLTALVAQAHGLGPVIISDIQPSRREIAASLGLCAVSSGEELLHSVEAATSGEGVGVLFECTGAASAALEMTKLVRGRATIINLGVFKKGAELDLQAVNFKEISIHGSRVYSREDFKEAIRLASTLPVSRIVTHRFELRDVQQALQCFKSGKNTCKVMVLPNGPVA
jgi:threonine dehydrogenase-like Zn-dependent dehydrogenase